MQPGQKELRGSPRDRVDLVTPRDRGAVGRESTVSRTGPRLNAGTVLKAVGHEQEERGELVDMSKFPHLLKAAKAALGKSTFQFSSDYTRDPDFGYDCSKLWDKSNYRVADDDVEFGARMRALASRLADVHLDDIPRSKVESTLRATNGHVGRAMQALFPMARHPPPESIRKELAVLTGNTAMFEARAMHEQLILPESVVMKIDELPEEKARSPKLTVAFSQPFHIVMTYCVVGTRHATASSRSARSSS